MSAPLRLSDRQGRCRLTVNPPHVEVQVERYRYEHRTTATGGKVSSRVHDHWGDVVLDIEIDPWSLECLCRKAASNKSRKSKAGPVTVTVLSERRAG